MKTYILTESDLSELGTLRWASTASFSMATLAFGFWLSVTQGFAFSEKLAPVTVATWNTWQTVSLWAAGLLAVIGVLLMWRGHCRLSQIKSEMQHND